MIIRQSTEITVKLGPFLDATDGVSEETGLAGGGTEISKNGAAFATGPTLGTHDAEGWYPITLTTSHTDTVGRLRVKSHASATHLPVWLDLQVIEEVVYDALFASSALGPILAGANSVAVSFTAGLSISNGSGDALTLASSGGNGSGLAASGNGTGAGVKGTGGATGQGILGVGGSSSGAGIRGTGTAGNSQGIYGVGQGSAAGVHGVGGATGQGILGVGGATSGEGIRGTGTAGNSQGIAGVGQGSAAGIRGTGGTTGHGIYGVGGATGGDGINAAAVAGNGRGINAAGQGSGPGLRVVGGSTGAGLSAVGGATSGDGIEASVTSGAEIDADMTGNITGTIDTCTTNTDMRGTDGANTTAPDNAGIATAAAAAASAASTASTIDGKVDTLLSRITSTLFSGITSLAQWLGMLAGKQTGNATALTEIRATGAGSGTFDPTTDSEEAIRDRGDSAWITGGGGGGSGAYVVTVTVDDGSSPLENVIVRLREGANNFTATTNASGIATFALDNATYTISMTKVGYQFTPTTIAVSGAGDFPKSMTAITVSASSPGFATGVLTCYDEDGAAESGVRVMCQIIDGPGTAGLSYDSTERTEVSGGDGVVQFTNMVIGADYDVWRTDRSGRVRITVPNSASFNIAEVIGKP